MQVLAYGPDQFVESSLEKVDAVRDYLQRFPVVWINVDGLGDAAVIERIGEVFNLHRLALEDVVHTHQRAKVDDYDEVLFIVLRMADIHFSADTEQLSMFVAETLVLAVDADNVPALRIYAASGLSEWTRREVWGGPLAG